MPCANTADHRLGEITEATIAQMIAAFYTRVRRDAVLGPIFEGAIQEDAWPAHMATMQLFWSSVMLATGRYSGNPVAVHHAVPGIQRPMFARWLGLFEETAHDLFQPAPAARFVEKARRIAGSLEIALFHRLGLPPDGIKLPTESPQPCA